MSACLSAIPLEGGFGNGFLEDCDLSLYPYQPIDENEKNDVFYSEELQVIGNSLPFFGDLLLDIEFFLMQKIFIYYVPISSELK